MATSNNFFNLVRHYPGLVSYWRLNEAAAATQAIDYSAHNSLMGTYTGASTPAPSVISENDPTAGSRLFTLSSGVSVPDIAQLRLTSTFSIAAWISPSSQQTVTLLGKMLGGIAAPYALGLSNGTLTVSAGNGSSQVTLQGPQVPVGIPSRVAGMLFRNTLYLCLNGTVWPTTQTLGSQAVVDQGQPLTFGYFAGLMGEVAVYNTALSALQQARNFALGRQIISDPSHFITVDPPVYT